MRDEPLSQHCSLMAHPERTELPADCPEDAVYIRHSDEGGEFVLNPVAPFPVVIEGGAGNDNVTVVGEAQNPVLIYGGKGNDGVVVQNDGTVADHNPSSWLIASLPTESLTFLGVFLITFAVIAALGWRALGSR